jgi:hypothetical protein
MADHTLICRQHAVVERTVMLLCYDVQVDRMREQLAAKDAAMLAAQPPLVRDLQVSSAPGSRGFCGILHPDGQMAAYVVMPSVLSERQHDVHPCDRRVWPIHVYGNTRYAVLT